MLQRKTRSAKSADFSSALLLDFAACFSSYVTAMMNYPCAAPLLVNSAISQPRTTFEPCRLLMHSNKSFLLSGCITHKELTSALKGSSQNNFTSLLTAEKSKQIRNAHSQPPHKVAIVISQTKQRCLFQSRFTLHDQLFVPKTPLLQNMKEMKL